MVNSVHLRSAPTAGVAPTLRGRPWKLLARRTCPAAALAPTMGPTAQAAWCQQPANGGQWAHRRRARLQKPWHTRACDRVQAAAVSSAATEAGAGDGGGSSGGQSGGGAGGSGHGGWGGGSNGGGEGPYYSSGGDGGIPVFLMCITSTVVGLATRLGLPPADQTAPSGGGGSKQPAAAASSSGSSGGGGAERPSPTVSIIVPALNEAKGIKDTLRYLKSLSPRPMEVIVVDGGSTDSTAWAAWREGARVVRSGRGRGRQMNRGAEEAKGDILIFVHADSRPPEALIPAVRKALANPRVVIGGFNTVIGDAAEGRVLWFHTAHQFLKTYYAPLFFRPLSFIRGLRALFGDQTLFCRAADFRRVGGYDGRLPIMEDLDLCMRLHMAGPGGGLRGRGRVVHLLWPINHTSGRRLGPLGNIWGTYVAARISVAWYFGATPERLHELYNTLWTDRFR